MNELIKDLEKLFPAVVFEEWEKSHLWERISL